MRARGGEHDERDRERRQTENREGHKAVLTRTCTHKAGKRSDGGEQPAGGTEPECGTELVFITRPRVSVDPI